MPRQRSRARDPTLRALREAAGSYAFILEHGEAKAGLYWVHGTSCGDAAVTEYGTATVRFIPRRRISEVLRIPGTPAPAMGAA